MNKTLLTALAVLALAATACSGGSEQPAAEAAQPAASAQTVSMADLAYTPAQLEVPAGTTVTWTNDDEAPHTVTFDGDAVADSDTLEPGDDFSTTFDEAGTYDYICAIHPDMKASVTVA